MLIKINRKIKDKKLRNKYLITELRRRYYKFMRLEALNEVDVENYVKYHKLLTKLPRNIITNYCYITGRGRGVMKKFRMSRHQIREKFRYLNGLTNSSW